MTQAGWLSKFINCCLSVNVRKFTSRISGKLCLQTRRTKLFYLIFAQKIIITANILSYKIESAKKTVHLLDLHIKTINLFYNYIFVCI